MCIRDRRGGETCGVSGGASLMPRDWAHAQRREKTASCAAACTNASNGRAGRGEMWRGERRRGGGVMMFTWKRASSTAIEARQQPMIAPPSTPRFRLSKEEKRERE
eukprot:1230589-Rhodomonas_salina.1